MSASTLKAVTGVPATGTNVCDEVVPASDLNVIVWP
jgi:hypothetical protein